jgi:hypothetical protein
LEPFFHFQLGRRLCLGPAKDVLVDGLACLGIMPCGIPPPSFLFLMLPSPLIYFFTIVFVSFSTTQYTTEKRNSQGKVTVLLKLRNNCQLQQILLGLVS